MSERPYADTAQVYWRAGWPNPIPVRGKNHPVSGYTGYDGANVSWPDLQAWAEGAEGGHNIALRLPTDVVGIDIDAYGDKLGEASIAAAEAELGGLPSTYRSTSRAPFAASGIKFYRVSASVDLRGAEKRLTARFGEHVDVIRRDHRYAVVWPSLHPHTGWTYRWYDPTGAACDPPRPADLPELPQAWQDFLTAPQTPAPAPVVPGVAQAEPDDRWNYPREFTEEEAVVFIRPAFAALRAAADGTINNKLNEAAVTIGHFVPTFWSAATAQAWLLDALSSTVYDGKTWRAETTIASGLKAQTWRAVRKVNPNAPDVMPERALRRGIFAGIRGRHRSEPRFVCRTDGKALLYPGKDSYLYAETESGKSWLAALTVKQCLDAEVPVMVVDFEEGDEIEYGNRLLDLGANERHLDDPARFRYLMVEGRATPDILAEAADMQAQVIINEGMSVAYDLYGLQVKENDSATAFRRMLVKPHLVAGRAVLTTDHVVKDKESRGRYAIGGVMKLNAASGGAFLLVNVEGLAPGRRGASNLYVTKDRPGAVKRHGVSAGDKFDPQVRRVGTLIVDDSRAQFSYLDVSIVPPAEIPIDTPKTITLSDRVLGAVMRMRTAGREPTVRAIRAELGGRVRDTDFELERLVSRGLLIESSGPRNARVFDRVPDLEEDE